MLKSTFEDFTTVAGCDEAGRGCLAGPVCAAAVILPRGLNIDHLNDSKQLSEKQRYLLRDTILKESLDYAVAFVDNEEIDRINILNASILAMHRALDAIKRLVPEFILVDGNKFKQYRDINHLCVVKGDATYACIAGASILAKTYRDDLMVDLSKNYPEYLWEQNKGYPTAAHAAAILKYGFSPFHRKTFAVPTQTKLF
ncbi:MAG: ribonuclease HII [Bacteroidales bacterium]|nr:ribonuclease HII [Bacteroidales bacterium]